MQEGIAGIEGSSLSRWEIARYLYIIYIYQAVKGASRPSYISIVDFQNFIENRILLEAYL